MCAFLEVKGTAEIVALGAFQAEQKILARVERERENKTLLRTSTLLLILKEIPSYSASWNLRWKQRRQRLFVVFA